MLNFPTSGSFKPPTLVKQEESVAKTESVLEKSSTVTVVTTVTETLTKTSDTVSESIITETEPYDVECTDKTERNNPMLDFFVSTPKHERDFSSLEVHCYDFTHSYIFSV